MTLAYDDDDPLGRECDGLEVRIADLEAEVERLHRELTRALTERALLAGRLARIASGLDHANPGDAALVAGNAAPRDDRPWKPDPPS